MPGLYQFLMVSKAPSEGGGQRTALGVVSHMDLDLHPSTGMHKSCTWTSCFITLHLCLLVDKIGTIIIPSLEGLGWNERLLLKGHRSSACGAAQLFLPSVTRGVSAGLCHYSSPVKAAAPPSAGPVAPSRAGPTRAQLYVFKDPTDSNLVPH